MLEVDGILQAQNKRNKRILDFLLSILFLLTLPFIIWFVKNKLGFIRNIFSVMFSQKTWVAYYLGEEKNEDNLPNIKKGVLHPGHAFKNETLSNDTLQRLNLLYSRDYHVSTDLEIIWRGFTFLGK
jgi:hypothetical protein